MNLLANVTSNLSFAPLWLWVAFLVVISILLAVDLYILSKLKHEETGTSRARRNALIESALWISVALIFNAWLGMEYGRQVGVEFLTGYLVEKSLSVDNLFIILLIFSSLKISGEYQHRVLFYGILGAIFFRAVFIILGAQLIHTFHWVIYLFGLILVVTAIKFLKNSDDEIDPEHTWSMKIIGKMIPITTKTDGNHFFTKINGKTFGTPLFVALVVIEGTDIIFAVDSIPAVFAVTNDAFIAFSSNILAILGLRALYFVFADLISKLRYLKPGLATILGYIGIKMLLTDVVKIPSSVSLLVIVGILTTASLSSWYVNRRLSKNQQL